MADRGPLEGVVQMKAEEYHARPELSSTGARQILAECPAKFWFERNNPPEPSDALDVGSAAHEWLLEGETWPQRHGILPESHNARTKDGQQQIADIKEAGKRPLKWAEFETIKAMVKALQAHPFAHAAFKNGKPEQSLFWSDAESGIRCRARLDWLPNSGFIIPDYKTTRSAEPAYLQKAMYDYGYHQQAEWYLSGVRALGLRDKPQFLLVFQEKEPPFLVTCVVPSPEALGWAAIMNRKARHVFAECIRTGHWPGYADDVVTLDLPGWASKQMQEKHDSGLYEVAMKMQAPLTVAAE